ncbi:MAG TPA: hypothetical protein P5205_04350 [Candidatus Paceibacterota bacterium]|nr:hypothetical protein [Verrucomicrobiota bacterium]HSA09581.1 hypothetical protein [Candidatus Paceibacterota bacterium]
MKIKHLLPVVAAASLLLAIPPALAQQHRAVRLGHPATRFAPPLKQPEQLRALFANEKLKADVEEILRQAQWEGNVEDLRRAAASAPITELSLPVGTRMPYMSSRKNGRPVALIDVLWDGTAPVSAYAFDFTSNGRRYRCITPRPCSNFYTVDLGPTKPELTLGCNAPGQAIVERRFDVCLTVTNLGTAVEPQTTLRLDIPADATVASATDQGVGTAGTVVWSIGALQPMTAKQVCATLVAGQSAQMAFAGSAEDSAGKVVRTRCETQVAGIPAILLETADLDDPIELGKEVVYEIKVTNQGTAPGTNLKVTCALPESEEFVSGTGPTPVQGQDRTVTMDTLPVIEPKAQAVWRVTVRALKPDDARFKVFISSDQFQQPIQKDEATQLY